jgi:hypothetical protein
VDRHVRGEVLPGVDIAYGVTGYRIRTGSGPRVMATIRNLAISLFRSMGFRFTTEAIRAFTFCSNRKDVLDFWGLCQRIG